MFTGSDLDLDLHRILWKSFVSPALWQEPCGSQSTPLPLVSQARDNFPEGGGPGPDHRPLVCIRPRVRRSASTFPVWLCFRDPHIWPDS